MTMLTPHKEWADPAGGGGGGSRIRVDPCEGGRGQLHPEPVRTSSGSCSIHASSGSTIPEHFWEIPESVQEPAPQISTSSRKETSTTEAFPNVSEGWRKIDESVRKGCQSIRSITGPISEPESIEISPETSPKTLTNSGETSPKTPANCGEI